MKDNVGVIGGSGVYSVFEEGKKITVRTPYGKVKNIKVIKQEDKMIYFLARHGSEHNFPPHKVNYRANMFALYKLGVRHVFATNAVGAIAENLKLGDFVLPDQFIDFTKNRPYTFFDGKTKIKFSDGEVRKGVVHLDYTEPYCPRLREILKQELIKEKETVHENGVIVCTEGPRFETAAEIKMFKQFGGTIVGMTTVPEVILARELKMCYATMCFVTNFAAGLQKEKLSMEEVMEIANKKISTIQRVLKKVINGKLYHINCNCV